MNIMHIVTVVILFIIIIGIFLLLLLNSSLADKVDYDIEEYFSSLYIFSIEYSQDYKSIFLENGIVIDADKETNDPRVKYRAFFVRELISFFTSDSLTSLFTPVFISLVCFFGFLTKHYIVATSIGLLLSAMFLFSGIMLNLFMKTLKKIHFDFQLNLNENQNSKLKYNNINHLFQIKIGPKYSIMFYECSTLRFEYFLISFLSFIFSYTCIVFAK